MLPSHAQQPSQLPTYAQQRQAMLTPPVSTSGGMSANAAHAQHASSHNWSNIDFAALYNMAQQSKPSLTGGLSSYAAMPFPPAHLLAMYPPDYQQKLLLYYKEVSRVYPDLYNQYVQYYETYYKPLYFPRAEQLAATQSVRSDADLDNIYNNNNSSVSNNPHNSVYGQMNGHDDGADMVQQVNMPPPPTQPPQQKLPLQAPATLPEQPPRQPSQPPQQSHQQPPPLERRPSMMGSTGGIQRQSSIRRQNSVRRSILNRE